MPTVRTVTFQYRGSSPDDVAALLQDPVFLRSRSEAAGEYNIDVQVAPEQDGIRVRVAREKQVDIPAFAKVALGSASKAVESTLWRKQGDTWVAEYTIEVSGVPVKSEGRSTLAPNAEGCLYTSTFELNVRIPLVGKRIEAFVADGLVEQLTANAQRNAEALERSRQRGPRSDIEQLRGAAESEAG
jgi:hypothetical protein